MYDRATLSVIHTIKKQRKLQFSILALSLSLSLCVLQHIIYTHFTHIMAKNTTAMATFHIITEKILLCTPLLSLLTKCLIDSNKILIINIFAIKQRVNRKKISVIIFCVHTIKKQHKLQFSILALSLSVCVATHNLYTFYTHNGRNTTAIAILGVTLQLK